MHNYVTAKHFRRGLLYSREQYWLYKLFPLFVLFTTHRHVYYRKGVYNYWHLTRVKYKMLQRSACKYSCTCTCQVNRGTPYVMFVIVRRYIYIQCYILRKGVYVIPLRYVVHVMTKFPWGLTILKYSQPACYVMYPYRKMICIVCCVLTYGVLASLGKVCLLPGVCT